MKEAESGAVPAAVRQMAVELLAARPMRRGSLSERLVKCNRPGCGCAHDDEARHGPYYSITRGVGGRTRSRWVAADKVEVARRQVAAGQGFRERLEAYWEACERWADAQLDCPQAASTEAAKKGGSKRVSTRKSRRKSKRVTYSAAIESAATGDTDAKVSEFAQRVAREAHRRGFERAQRRVILGDGAVWIWNLADEHFPSAIQIVDLFHAKGHLIDVAKAVWGPTSELGRTWAKARHDELDAGDVEAIERALAVHADACEEARKCSQYLARNRERMRYAKFRAQGLCVSTGVVEAGCKVAVGTRLKRAGMHWTLRGANAIVALRCARLSGRFEDFWERRALRCAA